MDEKRHENIIELPRGISSTPPAVELLSDPATASAAWPRHIALGKEFLRQVEARKELNDRLDAVISNLPRPDMSLEEATARGYLTENQVIDLYSSLSFLLEDPDYKRIVFYIPFEFLPSASWRPASPELTQAAEKFRAAYMKAWNDLLIVHDVRANFVDGDVLEVKSRQGDLPRVVKAAHLIPKLVEKGFLSVEDVLELLDESEDATLKQSIADTLPVLADMGFIHDEKISQEIREQEIVEIKNVTLSSIQNQLDQEFEQIDVEEYGDITEKRKAWLRQDKKRKAIELAGDNISDAIIAQKLDNEAIEKFLESEINPVYQLALIDGIRKAIETTATTDAHQAKMLYKKYNDALLSLWQRNVPELHEALSKTFYRLHGLHIVSDKELSDLGLTIPALAGPFSQNLEAMRQDLDEIRSIVASIETNAEALKYIYPVVLVFGSRLKGYGTKDADIDIAVFVRPETSKDDLEKLRTILKQIFTHKKIQGEVVEFWLEEYENGLSVQNLESVEPFIGDGSWTHVLFGAAWEGNKDAIKELRDELLVPYFYDDEDKMIHGRRTRGLYLEELERDTLQYRLMHRGYRRFFPSYGGIRTPHADGIDGQSVFWDSGYRLMATKLFASRVFLPKISRP